MYLIIPYKCVLLLKLYINYTSRPLCLFYSIKVSDFVIVYNLIHEKLHYVEARYLPVVYYAPMLEVVSHHLLSFCIDL